MSFCSMLTQKHGARPMQTPGITCWRSVKPRIRGASGASKQETQKLHGTGKKLYRQELQDCMSWVEMCAECDWSSRCVLQRFAKPKPKTAAI